MAELWTNNAASTLAAAATAGATGLTLRAGEGARFPSPSGGDYFWLTLEKSTGLREIVKVTARAGDALTVVRAQQGTAATAFAIGDTAEHRWTAKSAEDLRDASGGGSGDSRAMTQALIDSLVWVDQGTNTLTLDGRVAVLTHVGEGADHIRQAELPTPLPSGDWHYRARLFIGSQDSDGGNGWGAGLTLRESGTGKLLFFGMVRATNSPTRGMRVYRATDQATITATPASLAVDDFDHFVTPILLDIRRVSGVLYFAWSRGEGGSPVALFNEAIAVSFTTEPDAIGLGSIAHGTIDAIGNFAFIEEVV